MRKSPSQIKADSQKARFILHWCIHELGNSPDVALKKALPEDDNRKAKLETWKKHGLWPLPDDEMPAYNDKAEKTRSRNKKAKPEQSESKPKAQKPIEPDTDDHLRQIVRNEVERMMESIRPTSDLLEAAPFPSEKLPREGKGRPPSPGHREPLGTTLDGELYKLFREECIKRGMTAARLLDTIIWHYFGKPRLSFEISDESD